MKWTIFLLLIFMCGGVIAVSGVSPASYEVDFEPGYKGSFEFNFVVDGSEDLYAEGDLAEYVSFNKNSVSGREEVVVSLNLPSEIDIPGVNYIRIIAGNVVGVVKVDVPYPEKYVEVGLNAPNANAGEDVLFVLELFGKGNELVVVSPRIEIYRDGEEIDVIGIDDVEVFPGDEISVNVSINTSDYLAGDYMAVAVVDYDGVSVSMGNPFLLGEFSVELVDYTKSFRENKIDRFEILIESLWDDDIDGVYAEVNVLGFDSASFASSSEDLDAWGRRCLLVFWMRRRLMGVVLRLR